jgi:hypothetical protein
MKRVADSLLVPVALAVLVVVFLWPIILPPAGLAPPGDDIVAQFYPWSRIFLDGLRHGRLALWNPYSFLGMPFQAQPQSAEFYPLTWLFTALDAGKVFGIALAFHLWLAAFGVYALARTCDVNRSGALLSGLTFIFGGFVSSKIFVGFHDIFATMAWMIWALAALQRAWRGRSFRRAALAGLPIALSALAGSMTFFQYTLIAIGAMGAYLISLSWRDHGRREAAYAAGQVALALICGLFIAAVQLLPTFELARWSSRAADVTYAFASDLPLPLSHLLMLAAPDIFGAPNSPVKYWGAPWYHEIQMYVGILPLVFALMAVRRGDRRKWFWVALGGGALLYALGAEGFLHTLFFRFVPGIGLMRLPARASVLFTLSLSMLAGLGWEEWTRGANPSGLPRSRPFEWAGVLGMATGLLAFIEATFRSGDATARAQLVQVASQSWRFAALLGLTYLVLRWRWNRTSRPAFLAATFALVLFDLWSFGGKFVLTQPLQPNSTWWPLADRVMASDRANYRVLEYGFNIIPGTNDHILFRLQSLGGYDSLMPSDTVDLTEVNYALEPKLLDMLAVRYILINDKTVIDASDYHEVTHDVEDGVVIYERKPQKRAFIVHQLQVTPHGEMLARMTAPAFDPRRTALIESSPGCALADAPGKDSVTLASDELDRVTFKVHAASDGFLVMSDTFYPGWQADVDGRRVPVVRTNFALRGICLPAGDHEVMFSFEPVMLRVGIGFSAIGWVVVIILVLPEIFSVMWRTRRARHASRAAGASRP